MTEYSKSYNIDYDTNSPVKSNNNIDLDNSDKITIERLNNIINFCPACGSTDITTTIYHNVIELRCDRCGVELKIEK